ncbi:MAG: ABC transporter permease, partial [Gammaproteobacteria bacterium]|nr:ABC transporter permease [Gammaproteobacteria bacterium]NIR98456.1 ABC transporter permease [Gammaproteobacteria bacterium]NIV21144.1 ABC transporter permease subunit [Gammaproteobacteria bacterium]
MEDQATTTAVLVNGADGQQRIVPLLARFSREHPLGAIGGVVVVLLVAVAALAPWIAPYGPKVTEFDAYLAPGGTHVFGTDHLGRDIFSRVVWGARLSLYVGLTSVGFGVTVGALWGIFTAYLGGTIDVVTQRIVDVLMGFPPIILALGLMAVLGQSVNNVILALVILLSPSAARTMRSSVLSLKEMAYVESARAVGSSTTRVIFRHLVPNCLGTYIVLFTVNVAYAIVVEAALSFLGLGSPPDEPSWGGMLTAATESLERAPWIALFPGIAISLVVFGLNLLGDSI